MSPELFVTYSFLLRGYSISDMLNYKQSDEPEIRVGYQMLVMSALKKYKYIEENGGVDKMLKMPEEWDNFVNKYEPK